MLDSSHCSTAGHGTFRGNAQLRLQASAMPGQDADMHKAGCCLSSQSQGEAADRVEVSTTEVACLTYGLLMPQQCLVGRGRRGASHLLRAAATGQPCGRSRRSQQHLCMSPGCVHQHHTECGQGVPAFGECCSEGTPTGAFLTYLRDSRVRQDAVTRTSSRLPRWWKDTLGMDAASTKSTTGCMRTQSSGEGRPLLAVQLNGCRG